jgi:hypothetical protein
MPRTHALVVAANSFIAFSTNRFPAGVSLMGLTRWSV